MRVYHGSDQIVHSPEIRRNERGRDFGFGFYTTTIKEQAERWAVRTAFIHSKRTGNAAEPHISVFEFDTDKLAGLSVKRFEEPSMEWLDLVIKCRSDISYQHTFDIVIGKIANDSVGETIDYVVSVIMRKEDALQRLIFEHINDQVCFCSNKALAKITFVESYAIRKSRE